MKALPFYFGYVSARAQYAYFGVDVDVLGLGTRDYVMRSPQGLLVPGGTPEEGQRYRHRYSGLRLLVQAGDRMLLVPDRWASSNSTLVFDLDDVRVRFRFVNQAP